MWNDVIYLVSVSQQDLLTGGFEEQESKRLVYAKKKSIGQSEFYQAQTAGLRPELKFVIRGIEYNGEDIVEYSGKRYSVYKTYQTNDELMELTCTGLVAKGGD